jgi:hypothetical protein
VRRTNFCVYSFCVRPHASKIVVRIYREEFSHSLDPELSSPQAKSTQDAIGQSAFWWWLISNYVNRHANQL